MSIDPQVLHKTVVDLLDSLDDMPPPDLGPESRVSAAAIIVILTDDEGATCRTWCSDPFRYQQMGLFAVGLETVTQGSGVGEEE